MLQQAKAEMNEVQNFFTKEIQLLSPEQLAWKPSPENWNIVEVIDHLNFYNRWYLPRIDTAITMSRAKQLSFQPFFKPGWLGAYFTKIMKPLHDGSLPSKMKAPKNAIPAKNIDSIATLQQFNQHIEHLLSLLQLAEKADLNHFRITTSLSPVIRLKMGDTILFFIAHLNRHFLQIKKLQAELNAK